METTSHEQPKKPRKKSFGKLLRILGPGLITGAADDDPSGIATYSQTGAQFGYGQLWTALFTLPLIIAVQEACARIGQVTGKGIVAVVKERYNRTVVVSVVILVLVANTINIGADIGAVAAAARLVVPINFVILTLGFTALILVLEIYTSYKTYARILKWLALALASYVLTVFIVAEPWGTILRATFVPHIEFSFAFLFIITGVVGTTISPYMFFWEANEEVEEELARGALRKRNTTDDGKPKLTPRDVRRMRFDNALGMIASNVVTWCIIVTTATVLFAHGITNIATSADAAQALEPLVHTFPDAGFLAKLIFSVGVVGLGLLAVPVLSSSASYAVAEAFNWREGLNLKLRRAHGFYGVITIATLIGLLINFIGIDPIKALVVTAVINGIIAVPLIFLIARVANDKTIMGEYTSGWLSNIFVWLTFACMGAAAIALVATGIVGYIAPKPSSLPPPVAPSIALYPGYQWIENSFSYTQALYLEPVASPDQQKMFTLTGELYEATNTDPAAIAWQQMDATAPPDQPEPFYSGDRTFLAYYDQTLRAAGYQEGVLNLDANYNLATSTQPTYILGPLAADGPQGTIRGYLKDDQGTIEEVIVASMATKNEVFYGDAKTLAAVMGAD